MFGRDQRAAVSGQSKPLERSIGLLINARDSLVCSAFCVDDATIATAAHCLFRTATETPPRLVDFEFARRDSKAGAVTSVRIQGAAEGAADQSVLAGSRRLAIKPPIEATLDWALVRLEKPVCRGAVLPVTPLAPDEIISAARERRLHQVAFHRDFAGWRLAMGRDCGAARNFEAADWSGIAKDFVDADNLILHTCDTGGASSGSPLLVDGPGGPSVIGINVGTYVHTRVLVERGEIVQRFKADPVANTGVSAAAFASELAQFKRAEILPAGARMRQLQSRLQGLSYYDGALDGRYGMALQRAITAWQKHEGQPVTGLATVELLRRLTGVDQSQAEPMPDQERTTLVSATRTRLGGPRVAAPKR